MEIVADLRALPGGARGEEHVVLTDDVPRAANTLEDPGRVRPATGPRA